MNSPLPSRIRVGRRYRANRLAGTYHVPVIGWGIGGLAVRTGQRGDNGLPQAGRMFA